MSLKLIDLNPDLKKLQTEGFAVEVRAGYLLVHDIPYVKPSKNIGRGILVSKLELAADRTVKPEDHKMFFTGDHPCTHEGAVIAGIKLGSDRQDLGSGIVVDHSFSNKPANGYTDYYHKVTSYVRIIVSFAQAIDPSVSAQRFMAIRSTDPEVVFNYHDTNSSRAEINVISEKLSTLKIGIVGLGGTGSYVLDFVAKTWVKEIHLFDGDTLLSHNAFRAPGAASFETLVEQPKKVDYYSGIYSQQRKFIIPHSYHLTSANVGELAGFDFVFVCMDRGEHKRAIIEKLLELRIPCVDVGMGIHAIDGSLTGATRVTTVTAEKRDHVGERISFPEKGENDYAQNIQIAELNAMNAGLAVIKWKKMFSVYHDLSGEHHSVYELNINKIINDEIITPVR